MMDQDNHEYDVQSDYRGEETPFATGTMALSNNALSSVMLQKSEAEPARIKELRSHEQDRSGSPVLLLGAQKVGSSVPSEATASSPQDDGENMAVTESRTFYQRKKKPRTSKPMPRTEAWCRSLQDDNDTLQTQPDDALREKTKLQQHLNDAEDRNLGLQTALSAGKVRIRELATSIKDSHRTIQALQNHAAA